jgi:hypothetical protein
MRFAGAEGVEAVCGRFAEGVGDVWWMCESGGITGGYGVDRQANMQQDGAHPDPAIEIAAPKT